MESLETYSAGLAVVRLMRENNIKVADLPSMEVRDYEKPTDNRVRLRQWLLAQLGEGKTEAPTGTFAEQAEAAAEKLRKAGIMPRPTPVGAR